MIKRVTLLLLSLLVAAGMVYAGGQGEDAAADEETINIAMVTDVGGVNDQSFNQSAWEGLQRAQEDFGEVEVSYLESTQESDYEPNLQALYDAGNDLIWGIGFLMADAIRTQADLNPDQRYAIIDYAWDSYPDNLIGIVFQAEQASFLVGYIAGRMTETGTVGFVGGIEGQVIDAFDYGYHAGVMYANQDVEVLRQYAESFTDAAIGKSIATNMYRQGADIVFHAAGGVGDGVIEAAREQDAFAIGVDRDQNDLAPEHVLTSAMKQVGQAMYNVAQQLVDGNWEGGRTVVYGLAEDGVGIAPTSDEDVPQDILDEVAELRQQIIDGEIEVPLNEETFEEFMANL
ncbi:MAG: BMP family lipoprotein [Alkalispirochaetaceae bacterium]